MQFLRKEREIKHALRRKTGYFLWNETPKEKTIGQRIRDGDLIMISESEKNLIAETAKRVGLRIHDDENANYKMEFYEYEAVKLFNELSKISTVDKGLLYFIKKGEFRFLTPVTLEMFFKYKHTNNKLFFHSL